MELEKIKIVLGSNSIEQGQSWNSWYVKIERNLEISIFQYDPKNYLENLFKRLVEPLHKPTK